MDLKITDEVVRTFRDKDSAKPHYRALYEKHDFLTAYAAHTDLRVADNPKGAIGREDEWESHGNLQLHFLINEGMIPASRLLDVGCGVGRAARRFVPYLNDGHYVGVDISAAALEHALALSEQEGWAVKRPQWLLTSDLLVDGQFDFIWLHSVFTHLPPQQIKVMIRNAVPRLVSGGKMLFTYRKANTLQPKRTGLKQFAMPSSYLATVASRHGLHAKPLSFVFPAHQNTMRLTHAAADVGDDDDDDE